jgi:hypothetical protein
MMRCSDEKGRCINGKFEIVNEIDGTVQTLTEKQLWTKSNIGEAIDKRAFVVEDVEV